jgi:hypothetical protein
LILFRDELQVNLEESIDKYLMPENEGELNFYLSAVYDILKTDIDNFM